MAINVLLVDDHELVRAGIQQLLRQSEDINVIGCANSGEDAIDQVQRLLPDVVLMDINMPGIGGIEASRKIVQKHPTVRIIALTVHTEGPFPQQLLNAGALGYISKSCNVADLIKAIRAVHSGKRYVSNDVATEIMWAGQNIDNSPFNLLSLRELQIVEMTLDGRSIQEMADLLKISSKTVNTYRYRVQEKVGVKNDVELTRLAIKYRLIQDS
ncbi:MAG: response regulator [Methylococcaceae bacterium]|nr:response regulator [Methylococcaceae bacterium]